MNYRRYKYTEADIADLIETAQRNGKSCVQAFKEKEWPFSLNVLNTYLVGRKTATTERLKTAIEDYKASYFRYSNYLQIPEEMLRKVISMREKGHSLSEISLQTGVKPAFVGYIVSGKMKHPSAPKQKISGSVGSGRKKKIAPEIDKGETAPIIRPVTTYSLLNKREVGAVLFSRIKEYIEEIGGSMHTSRFPSDFPISRRTVYYIGKGVWTESDLEKLPFRVKVEYTILLDG